MRMKEIKFLAWDKEDKVIRRVEEIHFDKDGTLHGLLEGGEGRYFFNQRVLVDGKWIDDVVLLQDTGLKDINKKPIYENFLLKNKNGQKFCIKYDKYYAWYCLHEVEDGTIMNNIWTVDQGIIQNYEIEIIGNIYQNPELVKEGDE